MDKIVKYDINLSTFFSLKDKKLSVEKAYTEGIYADTPANRKLGRVGMSYAEYASKVEKKDSDNIKDISVYKVEKLLEKKEIFYKRVRETEDYFQVLFESRYFTKDNIKKTKEVIESIGGKPQVLYENSSIKAFKKELKPIKNTSQKVFRIGDYKLDSENQLLHYKDGTAVELTPRETDLLKVFISSPNKVLYRDTILEKVWGESNYYNSRSLDVYVKRLRNLLAKDPDIDITTIWWKGFKLSLSKGKSNTKVTSSDLIQDVINVSKFKDLDNKTLDSIIQYSNSIDGIKGIQIKDDASKNDKQLAIAKFYIENSKLDGTDKEIADDLDKIIDDNLVSINKDKETSEKLDKLYGNTSSESKSKILKQINDTFGFEDENGTWFSDTPVSLIMADDKEFKKVIDDFTDYKVVSQEGEYKFDGDRKTMLGCKVTYNLVPKEGSEENKKQFTIDNKTTIKDILGKLSKE